MCSNTIFYNEIRPLSAEIGENGGFSDNFLNISCLRGENGENGFWQLLRRNFCGKNFDGTFGAFVKSLFFRYLYYLLYNILIYNNIDDNTMKRN